MAAVPFAMKKAENPLEFWLVYLVFGLALATFNYSMAVDLASRVAGRPRESCGSSPAQGCGT